VGVDLDVAAGQDSDRHVGHRPLWIMNHDDVLVLTGLAAVGETDMELEPIFAVPGAPQLIRTIDTE
jgi:hypothetical protein